MHLRNEVRETPALMARGFSLIELLVAMVLGLIVIGSLVTFVVSFVSFSNDSVSMTRLTQNLRTGMSIVQRELRRSGYDANAVNRVQTLQPASAYTAVNADEANSCVTFTYDRDVLTSESRGFRLNTATGALQMKVDGSPVVCGSNSGWEDVTDPKLVKVTKFLPALVQEEFCSNIEVNKDGAGVPTGTYKTGTGIVRSLALCLKGSLRSDPSVERYIVDIARLRADVTKFDVAATAVCGFAVKDLAPSWSKRSLPPSVDQLNKECSGL